jgi:hypothetical protein
MRREALSHPLAIAGVLVSTASVAVCLTLIIAMLAGLLKNPYAGLLVFVALPGFFVLGVLLVLAGARLRRRKLLRDPSAIDEWPIVDFRRTSVRRATLMMTALAAANVVIVLLAGYGTLHWMESPNFCGQMCHTPMRPQFTTWHLAPHARISCVSCHVGEGSAAFIESKLAGVRQLVAMTAHSYSRPIPPGAEMHPGAQAETCGACHQPGRESGDRIRVIREYADDEANTETITVLQMHLGKTVASTRAIHWHTDPAVRVEYVATDAERQTIPWVRVTDRTGRTKEYAASGGAAPVASNGARRTMDCIDCHNTVGHPVAATAEGAVDRAIASARVSRDLPFARREIVRLVKASYPTEDAAMQAIAQNLRRFYETNSQSADSEAVSQAVATAQDVYRQNVFPAMNVTWGSYPDNKGHMAAPGCFRCHDDLHKAADGSAISGNCELCHKQVERPGP